MDLIEEKITKVIDINFKNELTIEGIINFIENNMLIINADNFEIKCISNMNLSSLNINDRIKITGFIKINKNQIYINAKIIYKIDQQSQVSIYNRLNEILDNKYKKNIFTISKKKEPINIKNIGLIFINNSFKEDYKGKIFTYKMKNNINIPFEFFKKYHNIDVICLIADNLTLEELLMITSTSNIKYLLKADVPYFISITQSPLIKKLSNKSFDNNKDAFEYIKTIQTNYENKVIENIKKAKQKANNIIKEKKDKLLELKLYISELYKPSYSEETIKSLLMQKILNQKITLYKTKIELMETIQEDNIIKQILNTLIEEVEKKIEKNNLNENIIHND